MIMKIDLTDIKVVPTIGAQPVTLADAREIVSNKCYQSATEIWQDELAHRLYRSEGAVELTDREAEYIRDVLVRTSTPLFIRKPIIDKISE